MDTEEDLPSVQDAAEKPDGKLKTFTVKGLEKIERKIERGNVSSSKLYNLPPDWVGHTVTIIRTD